MKGFLVSTIITITLLIISSCTQKSSDKSIIKDYQVPDSVMTVEKYADMDFELASTLFEKYYEKLKDKKYEEVKDIFRKFLIEKESIYKKYNVKDPQNISAWARQNKVQLRAYRETHPEINYYNKFPEFKEANMVLYKLAQADHKAKQ